MNEDDAVHSIARLMAGGLLLPALAACGGSGPSLATCANGIVVFEGVDCGLVEGELQGLPVDVRQEIETLRAEALADPSRALANSQTISRLMAAAPFSVCAALQTSPDGEFLATETIAPIAARLAETTCPPASELP